MTIVVVDDRPRIDPEEELLKQVKAQAQISEIIASMKRVDPPAPVEYFDHVNGDLSYLYRRPKNNLRMPIRKNHRRIIHQPCWRATRWKSLT